jgi:dihydroorotate dehydrogenase (NAD+) catalytic subunit
MSSYPDKAAMAAASAELLADVPRPLRTPLRAVNLSTGCNFLGKDISGPFTIGSGIITVTLDTLQLLAEKVPQLGVLTTKSIGPAERTGNREPVYVDLTGTTNTDREGQPAWANAVGLAGPGCEYFAEELASLRLPPGKFLLISIFGGTTEEFVKVAQTLAPFADGLELNFSCPHAEGHGQAICATPGLAAEVVRAVRAEVGDKMPIVPKLSPNLEDEQLKAVVPSLLDAGASAFTVINTLGPVENKHGRSQANILTVKNGRGGMSGAAVRKRGLEVVGLVRSLCDLHGRAEVPIIGMGGITTAEDCSEFAKAGSNILGVGSSLTGLSTEELACRFAELASGGKPAKQLPEDFMHFKEFTLRSIEHVNEDLGLLRFEEGMPTCRPGQFVSVWLPGTAPSGEALGEKPFAPAVAAAEKGLCLAVRAVGTLTKHLVTRVSPGDKVYIRGPYGNPFSVPLADSVQKDDVYVMVGGGTGIAPLLLFAEKLRDAGVSAKNIRVYLGGRSTEHIYFEEEFKAYSDHVAVATNDGSLGFKGFVTDCLKADLPEITAGGEVHYANCGPELMMATAVKVQEAGRFATIECSVERYMKCGVGICGVCSCDGLRTCVDGPILGYDFLKESSMFGKKHRAKTTKLLDW